MINIEFFKLSKDEIKKKVDIFLAEAIRETNQVKQKLNTQHIDIEQFFESYSEMKYFENLFLGDPTPDNFRLLLSKLKELLREIKTIQKKEIQVKHIFDHLGNEFYRIGKFSEKIMNFGKK